MSRLTSLALLWLLGAACGPNAKAPVAVMALIPDESGTFVQRQIQLTTVGDITTLTGSVVQFIGSTRVVVDSKDPLQQLNGGLSAMTDEQRYEVLVKDKGGPVRGQYIDRSGVLWPADFHTWNMVSAYYNFERAYSYFNELYDGEDPKELRPLTVHYWCELQLQSATAVTDNAVYLSLIRGFALTPFKDDQLVPLPMNIGVIGHEVAHRVFNTKALSGQAVHPALGWERRPFNLLKSLDEGLSDFHGYSVTRLEPAGDRPNYLSISIADSRTVGFRDVSRTDACMDVTLRSAFTNSSPTEWITSPNQYRVGNLIAAALYQAGNKRGKLEVLQKALITAYDDESTANPGLRQILNNSQSEPEKLFTPERVANTIIGHVGDPDLRRELCTEFASRLQLRCARFPCQPDGAGTPDLMPACNGLAAGRDSSICPTLPDP